MQPCGSQIQFVTNLVANTVEVALVCTPRHICMPACWKLAGTTDNPQNTGPEIVQLPSAQLTTGVNMQMY